MTNVRSKLVRVMCVVCVAVLSLSMLAFGMGAVPNVGASNYSPIHSSYVPIQSSNNSVWFHGIDISGRSGIDMYYLRLPLAELNSKDLFYHLGSDAPDLVRSNIQRSSVEVEYTFLFGIEFRNLRIRCTTTGLYSTIFITFHARVRFARNRFWDWTHSSRQFSFINPTGRDAFYISLSNNYYQYLRRRPLSDFRGANIMFLYFGTRNLLYNVHHSPSWHMFQGVPSMQSFDIPNITFHTRHAPPGEFDPDSPDFNLDAGNTGTNTVPPGDRDEIPRGGGSRSPWDSLLRLLSGLFGIDVSTIQNILILAGIGLVVIITASIVIPLVKSK